MSREEIIADNPLSMVLAARGVKMIGTAPRFSCCCPFHKDKNPSMTVNDEKGLWHCHAGCGGGSVIDLWSKLDGVSIAEVLRRFPMNGESQLPVPIIKHQIAEIYSYENELGIEVFQVCRMYPKTFRQRHRGKDGNWIWNMEGVTRVLYCLPQVLKSERAWVVEGEKDARNLQTLGFTATTNVGGAGKWLDSYTESLTDKEIILCGDNDKTGIEHMDNVFKSISGKVKNIRQVKVPSPHKDVSDWIASFKTAEDAKTAIQCALDAAIVFVKGVYVPIYSLTEIESRFIKHLENLNQCELDLSRWLPSLKHVRSLVPGELMSIVADTGQAKTFALQCIARIAAPLPTVMFEMELPETLLFERFVMMQTKLDYSRIRQIYMDGGRLGEEELSPLSNIYVCTESGLTVEKIEQYINHSELKIGHRPKLVLIDYIQLIRGTGRTRRDVVADAAENLKILAKSSGTIIILATQIARKNDDEEEIFLHDPKESGSIESSSGFMLGLWRNENDRNRMTIKILKNTKGTAGMKIQCRFKEGISGSFCGEIVEVDDKIDESDIPRVRQYKD